MRDRAKRGSEQLLDILVCLHVLSGVELVAYVQMLLQLWNRPGLPHTPENGDRNFEIGLRGQVVRIDEGSVAHARRRNRDITPRCLRHDRTENCCIVVAVLGDRGRFVVANERRESEVFYLGPVVRQLSEGYSIKSALQSLLKLWLCMFLGADEEWIMRKVTFFSRV